MLLSSNKFSGLFFAAVAVVVVHANNNDNYGIGNGNANVPDHVLLKFKTNNGVKANANLPLQAINGNGIGSTPSVTLPDGTIISLDDDSLEPVNVYTSSANCYEDGIQKLVTCPSPTVFSKIENGYKILVSKSSSSNNGKIRSIKARKQGSSNSAPVTLQAVDDDGDVVTYIPEDAIDDEFFGKYTLMSKEPQEDDSSSRIRRALRGKIEEETNQDNENQNHHHNSRQLNGACTSYRIIEVAVATDSSFCNTIGSSNVAAKIQSIIADVSIDYEQEGLCFKALVSHQEIVSVTLIASCSLQRQTCLPPPFHIISL